MSRVTVLSVVALTVLLTRAGGAVQPHGTPRWETGTFSILGYDPATGEVGGAVQSRVFSVGNGVLWAEANVGVVTTQAIVDVSYGPQALDLGGPATKAGSTALRRATFSRAKRS
jgi:hypothetical protein